MTEELSWYTPKEASRKAKTTVVKDLVSKLYATFSCTCVQCHEASPPDKPLAQTHHTWRKHSYTNTFPVDGLWYYSVPCLILMLRCALHCCIATRDESTLVANAGAFLAISRPRPCASHQVTMRQTSFVILQDISGINDAARLAAAISAAQILLIYLLDARCLLLNYRVCSFSHSSVTRCPLPRTLPSILVLHRQYHRQDVRMKDKHQTSSHGTSLPTCF